MSTPTPTPTADRIESLDLLRGIAVLGILGMNIYAFAMPDAAYENPLVHGGTGSIDIAAWAVTHVLLELKFITIFSLLFGAGIVLFTERLEARDVRPKGFYYRRMLWLAVFGLLHGVFLWHGDILLSYAWCGALLYPLRRKPPRVLAMTGGVLFALFLIGMILFGAVLNYAHSLDEQSHGVAGTATTGTATTGTTTTDPAQSAPGLADSLHAGASDVDISAADSLHADTDNDAVDAQEQLRQVWLEIRAEFEPSPEQIEEKVAVYRSGYLEILSSRLTELWKTMTWTLLMAPFWLGGVMAIGMALLKTELLTGARPTGFYRRAATLGYLIGIPIAALGAWQLLEHEFGTLYRVSVDIFLRTAAVSATVAGHLGLFLWLWKTNRFGRMRGPFVAAGRMAFSIYLAQTLICTTLFYGYGFGLFGRVDRAEQLGIVVLIWIALLAWSSLWMSRFRFGPAEWLWRALTYGERPPMRRLTPPASPEPGAPPESPSRTRSGTGPGRP